MLRVLVCAKIHVEIIDDAYVGIIKKQIDGLVVAYAALPDAIRSLSVQGSDDVNPNRSIIGMPLSIHLQAVAERSLQAAILHALCVRHHGIIDKLRQLGRNVIGREGDILDFLLHVLLFISEILPRLAITADVGLTFQDLQRIGDLLFLSSDVRAETVGQKHTDVLDGSGNAINILDENKHLEYARGQFINVGIESVIRVRDSPIYLTLDGILNTIKEFIEWNQFTNDVIAERAQSFSSDGEHGTFTHGLMLTIEHILVAHLLQRCLK